MPPRVNVQGYVQLLLMWDQHRVINCLSLKSQINEESKGKYAYSFFFNPWITIFPVPDLSQG